MSKMFVIAASTAALATAAFAPGSPVGYPEGFRTWTHVGSAVLAADAPGAGRFAGLHSIYANGPAMQGYRQGKFPDGSVIVFDLHEARQGSGVTAPGARRQLDVMVRDSRRFAATGGWGFAEFAGDERTARAADAVWSDKECSDCHAKAGPEQVFSRWRD